MNTARPTSGEVARWIADHLDAYPRAADSAEGIQRWWLAPTYGEVPIELVEQALAQLEGEGVVFRREMGKHVIFGRAPAWPGRP